jgi:hypothetical protein
MSDEAKASQNPSGIGLFAGGAAAAFVIAFFSLVLGIALTLGIQALTLGEQKSDGDGISEKQVEEIIRRKKLLDEERMFEILKGERDGHGVTIADLRKQVFDLRASVREWQTYCENTRCRCRHPGTPGAPGAVGAAVMEAAPPKIGEK